MDQETEDLLKKMEQENGGPIVYKTYCRMVGFSDGTVLNVGGLLYVVNGKLIFEDFEKQPGLMDFLSRSKKKYEKFKTYRLLDDIKEVKKIRASYARRVMDGKVDGSNIPPISGIEKLFSQSLIELSFSEQPNWYIELLEDKEFMAFIKESKDS